MSSSPTRSGTDAGSPPAGSGPAARWYELRRAARLAAGADGAEPRDPAATARGSAFLPAIGLALGAVVAGVLLVVEAWLPRGATAALGVLLLAASSRATVPLALARLAGAALAAREAGAPRSPRATPTAGWAVLAVVLAAEVAALAGLEAGTLALGVLLATLLGRWAMVVHAYGSLPARPEGFAATYVAKLEFREFGIASVSSMAMTLVLANAIGLVLLLGVAVVTVGLRIVVHRWLGGVTRDSILAVALLAELTTLLLCAALVALARGAA